MSIPAIDYTGKPLSALPFVYRPKRGSKELPSNWAVTPTTDYLHACNMGREYAAHFIQWLRQSDMACGNMLGLIVADMAGKVAPMPGTDDGTHGYAVGFLSYLERLLLALQALGSVTTYEASRYLDLYDPRARKKELCKEGHAIDTIPARVVTESGEVHRIGRYVLMTHAIQREAA